MQILKRILGALLLLLSIFLSFILLISGLKAVVKSIDVINRNVYEGIGYSIGSLLVIVLLFFLIRFMFKKSLKLISRKTAPKETIDDIGL